MKLKKWKIITAILLAVLFVSTAALTVYAYFSTRVYVYTNDGDKEILHVGANLRLLFDKLDSTKVADGTELKIPYYYVDAEGNSHFVDYDPKSATNENPATFDPAQPWGTYQNPYVISDVKHLQNLSALQSVGYFDMLYVESNFTKNGDTYTYNENGVAMPYFLVCNDDGTPVTIDATDMPTIKPIGSATHPFIGVIGGAFVDGTTNVGTSTSSVSALHNVKVTTTVDQVDVGLFGYIGYLGDEASADADTKLFSGAPSHVQNLLLSDVSVVVNKPSVEETISKLFEKLFGTNHRFTYTGKDNHYEENHHIGILAGHVSYASVEYVSVYYSNSGIYAIDLTAASESDNYHSSAGIVGFMHNMNANISADGSITTSGTSSEGESLPSAGGGTGGGIKSGSGRGYVTAAEIYAYYNFTEAGESMNEFLWTYSLEGNDESIADAILVLKNPDGTYTLMDGKTEAVLSGGKVTVNGTPRDYFVRVASQVTNDDGSTEPVTYTYYGADETTRVDDYAMQGDRQHGQQIWRFQAGGDGVWHYGILINKAADGTYTMETGETATVSNGIVTATVFPRDATGAILTDENKEPLPGVEYSWSGYMVKTTVDGETVYLDSTESLRVTSYNRKSMLLYGATNQDGDPLCDVWEGMSIGSIFQSGEDIEMYYFFDGVFTFALSSKDDTIADTWKNNEAPTIHLGALDPDRWMTDYTTGNKAVIAFLRPVTDNKTLDQAIKEGKQIYITARPTSETDAYLLSLQKANADDPMTGAMLNLDSSTGDTVKKSYEGGEFYTMPMTPVIADGSATERPMFYKDAAGNEHVMSVSDLLNSWADYKILNIGRTSETVPLETLKSKYNITADAGATDFYFRQDTGVRVIPEEGAIPEYASWDGYFFYTYTTSTEGLFIYETTYTFTFYYQGKGNAAPIPIGTTQNVVEHVGSGLTFDYSHVELGELFVEATNATYAQGELMYSQCTLENGTTLTPEARYLDPSDNTWKNVAYAPMINMTSPQGFHSTGSSVIINNSVVAKETGNSLQYYYYDVLEEEYFSSAGVDLGATDPGSSNGILLNKYPSYSFKDTTLTNSSYLQYITKYTGSNWFWGDTGEEFSIWAGTDSQFQDLSMKREQITKESVLVFVDNADYCYIRYAGDSSAHYLNYSYDEDTATGAFGSVASNGAGSNTQLYVYVIEGILDMDYGVHTFVPKAPAANEKTHALPADQYVLWPQTTLKQDGVYANGATSPSDSTYNAASTVSPDPVYSVFPLVGEGGLNWGNKDGIKLGSMEGFGLTQKFKMADQAGFGPMLSIGDFNFALEGKPTQLVAPVGTDGVNAVIPKGCVAFRVKEVTDESTVRIIVAVPTTTYYMTGYNSNGEIVTESGFNIDCAKDYYIGLWQVEAAGEQAISTFDKTAAVEKFELPRSYSFDFESMPADVETPANTKTPGFNNYITVEYNDGSGSQQYRTYLNGGTILVAYEFKVSAVGVYVIGSAHGSEATASNLDCPMEIVHFSVSGTADEGNDGVSGSKLGTVDFVYQTDGQIITVGTTNAAYTEEENYVNYYASRVYLFTANDYIPSGTEYVNLSSFKIEVYRCIDTGNDPNRTMVLYAYGSEGQRILLQLTRYSSYSDATEISHASAPGAP